MIVGGIPMLFGGGAAAPTFVAVATGTGSSVSPAANKPTGVVDNDVMIAVVASQGSSATFTPPAGWTSIRRLAHGGGGTASTNEVFRKTAAGEGASYTWTSSTSSNWAVIISAYRGVNSAPINAEAGQTNASSTNVVAPTITTTVPNCMLLFIGSSGINSSFTPPTGYAERADILANGTAQPNITLADKVQESAAATGTVTGVSASAAINIGFNIALAP